VHRDDLAGLAQLAEHTTNDVRAGPGAA